MAGSRLERFGTIFTRVTGLLRSGALKESEKPLWYDVYSAFPPAVEPNFIREADPNLIKKIFYPEDQIRAKFYQEMGRSQGVINLKSNNLNYLTVGDRFISRFHQIENLNPSLPFDDIFERTRQEFEHKKGPSYYSPKTSPPG